MNLFAHNTLLYPEPILLSITNDDIRHFAVFLNLNSQILQFLGIITSKLVSGVSDRENLIVQSKTGAKIFDDLFDQRFLSARR